MNKFSVYKILLHFKQNEINVTGYFPYSKAPNMLLCSSNSVWSLINEAVNRFWPEILKRWAVIYSDQLSSDVVDSRARTQSSSLFHLSYTIPENCGKEKEWHEDAQGVGPCSILNTGIATVVTNTIQFRS